MARKKIIAGNWKMNMTPSQAVELINTLKPLVATDEADVVFCVPAIDIIPAIEAHIPERSRPICSRMWE